MELLPPPVEERRRRRMVAAVADVGDVAGAGSDLGTWGTNKVMIALINCI